MSLSLVFFDDMIIIDDIIMLHASIRCARPHNNAFVCSSISVIIGVFISTTSASVLMRTSTPRHQHLRCFHYTGAHASTDDIVATSFIYRLHPIQVHGLRDINYTIWQRSARVVYILVNGLEQYSPMRSILTTATSFPNYFWHCITKGLVLVELHVIIESIFPVTYSGPYRNKGKGSWPLII